MTKQIQSELTPKTAAQSLADLRERQTTIKAELAAASRNGDANAVIDLTRESDELPTRIHAALLASLHERINTLEPQAAEAERDSGTKAEAAEVLRVAAFDATAKYEAALQESFAASSHRQSVRANLADARREIERTIAGKAHAAPIVRSLPHA